MAANSQAFTAETQRTQSDAEGERQVRKNSPQRHKEHGERYALDGEHDFAELLAVLEEFVGAAAFG